MSTWIEVYIPWNGLPLYYPVTGVEFGDHGAVYLNDGGGRIHTTRAEFDKKYFPTMTDAVRFADKELQRLIRRAESIVECKKEEVRDAEAELKRARRTLKTFRNKEGIS